MRRNKKRKEATTVVVATTNDSAYDLVADLVAAGVRVAAVVDSRPELHGRAADIAAATGVRLFPGSAVVDTAGDGEHGGTQHAGRAPQAGGAVGAGHVPGEQPTDGDAHGHPQAGQRHGTAEDADRPALDRLRVDVGDRGPGRPRQGLVHERSLPDPDRETAGSAVEAANCRTSRGH